jgi:CheY-like chemotaxis protein
VVICHQIPNVNAGAIMETQKTRILIVEDNADDEALLMHQLQKAQLHQHVKVIADGKVAVEYLTDNDSRGDELIAIFLDLNLPSMNGLHVLEKVRSHDRIRHLPVIVMTSSNSSTDLEKCRQFGVSCYVQKPITFATFAKAVADSFHVPKTHLGSLAPRPETAE